MVKPLFSCLMMITVKFSSVQKFRNFTVLVNELLHDKSNDMDLPSLISIHCLPAESYGPKLQPRLIRKGRCEYSLGSKTKLLVCFAAAHMSLAIRSFHK